MDSIISIRFFSVQDELGVFENSWLVFAKQAFLVLVVSFSRMDVIFGL